MKLSIVSIVTGLKRSYGFTLVEMAITLVIVGILLAMLIQPFRLQKDMKDRTETLGDLNQINEALVGYAIINRHLPCPDTDAIPDGIENREGTGLCSDDQGVLPWNTLGVKSTDSWNRYYGYRADATFSSSATLFTIDDAEGATGIQINGEAGSLVSTNSRPAAVVISYGMNGFGAINTTQATPANQMPLPLATALDEVENTDGDLIFVSHVPSGLGTANEFDDILVWVPPKVLINRMVVAGRLP